MCTRPPSYLHQMSSNVWPQPNTLPLGSSPQESVYQPDLQIDYGDPGRSYPQADFPPVFSPQSSNCSDNGDHVPSQSQDEYLDIKVDAWVLAENISDYDDNHSQPFLDDENTHCYDSDDQHGYPPDPPNLKDHSDLDSSWNSDQDSWLPWTTPDGLHLSHRITPLQRLVPQKQW